MDKAITSREELRRAVSGYKAARVIQVAAKMRIFAHTTEAVTAQHVSQLASVSIRGAELLLDALAALGLLVKRNNRYQNTKLAAQYLTTKTHDSLLHAIDHSERLYRRWAELQETVRTGMPVRGASADAPTERETSRAFTQAMHTHSSPRARRIVDALDLTGIRFVVDIGGGAGSYLIALGERIPQMEGVLIDRASTLEAARDILAGAGMLGNVRLEEMDIFSEEEKPFAENADLAILSNILHIEGSEANIRLLRRIRSSLHDNGRLLILEFLMDESATQPVDYALFGINMLVNTERGRAWRAMDVEDWLLKTGFGSITSLPGSTDTEAWMVECSPG